MTTFNINTHFPSSTGKVDFVSADAANLASHMSHCANSRSRFFALHSTLQFTHLMVCSHLVTVAALVAISLSLITLA